MNKGLKYNKEVRGTGDDWQSECCRMDAPSALTKLENS